VDTLRKGDIKMVRVVDYCRVSTEEEKQINALQTQQEEHEEFIKNYEGWVLVDRYIDEGKSATTTKGRNDFKRLLADMEKDKFDVILIKIIDRGWRNSLDWKLFEKMLIVNKKQLFIKSRNAFYDFNNPTDYMATGFEAQFAEWSSINQSIKMNQAHQTRMKKGTVVTNGKLWGYNQVNSKLEINEEEAEIIRYIFNSYITGKGFRTIANELNEKGIKNRNGKPFALTTLKRIIRQEKYKGVLICGKKHKNFWTKEYEAVPEDEWIIHENAVPAIVTAEMWQKANDILDGKRMETGINDKRKIVGYFNGSYSYSGKIKCGKCEKPYYHSVYTTGKNKDKKLKTWECRGYREHGKKSVDGCDNVRILENEMDSIIKQAIFMFWENKDETIDEAISILDEALSVGVDKNTLNKLNTEKNKIEIQKEKLIELYAEEIIDKMEFKARNDKCIQQLDNINKSIEDLNERQQITLDKRERLLKFKEFFDTNLTADNLTESIIKDFLTEVVVYPDNTIHVVLDQNHRFIAQKDKNGYSFPNVTNHGPHRYAYRDHAGKVQGAR
jgi:site-specific DNA recombinase